LKMIFCGLPLTRRPRGHPRDRLGEAEDRPQRDRSRIDQLPSQRIQLPRLRMFTEDNEPLNHERQHPPRPSEIRFAAPWQPHPLFLKQCERAAVIPAVRPLAKQRSGAESLKSVRSFQPACRVGMLQGAPPVTAKELYQAELYLREDVPEDRRHLGV